MPSTEPSIAPAPAAMHSPQAQAHASPAARLAQANRAPAEAARQQALHLATANRALWMATLSLMTAFMQSQAPAHRYLLARRISRNFAALAREDCFDTGCRGSFERLAGRWQQRADQLAPEPRASSGISALFS